MSKVTVIIPVYNVENYLEKCLNSVINQTYRELELIVVNDGSTDGSKEICEKYLEKDARISLINKENGGLSSARNAGIRKASGKYLYFLDSDDWLNSDSISNLVSIIINSGSRDEIVYPVGGYTSHSGLKSKSYLFSNSYLFDNREIMFEYISSKYSYSVWNKLYYREIVIKNNILFPEDISYCEDQIFNLKYLINVNQLISIDKPVYNYRLREGSITYSFNPNSISHYLDSENQILNFFYNSNFSQYKDIVSNHYIYVFNNVFSKLFLSKNIDKEIKKKWSEKIIHNFKINKISRGINYRKLEFKRIVFSLLLISGSFRIIYHTYNLIYFFKKLRLK